MRIILFLLFIAFFSCKKQEEKRESLETIKNPAALHSQTPNLFSNQEGLWMSWLNTKDSTDFLKFAHYKNGSWKTTTTAASGNDWFVNWADFPAIAINDGTVLTNLLQKSDSGAYTYDIKLNLMQTLMRPSMSDSISWKRNIFLHDDGTKSEHGFVSLQPYGQKSFYAVWLDGRNTSGMSHDGHSGDGGAMTLRGAIVSENGDISREEELDHRVCDCCQTDLAVTKDKQIIVAYRGRSDDEIRDVKIKKWSEATGWSEPFTVGNDNWKIAGCPVNGPALSSFNNEYVVAWFSAAQEEPKVQLAFGKGGVNELDIPININSNPTMGRVDLVMISSTEAVVSWIEDIGDDTLIQLLKVDKDGSKGEVMTVAKTSTARASGFPKLALNDKNIVIAYTLIERGLPSIIETKTVAVDAL
jgi:hypothetical protein